MPRVNHVKKARKDHPGGIKKGESYYWWKFRYGGKRYSKTYPARSQLTQSPYLSTLWSIIDDFTGLDTADQDEIQGIIEDLKGSLEDLQNEAEDSLSNMPDHLQEESESGQLLQERIDSLDEAIGELDSIDLDSEGVTEDNLKDWAGNISQEITEALASADQ